jgi:ribosomal protein S18 acetylase RimI-like enzyme
VLAGYADSDAEAGSVTRSDGRAAMVVSMLRKGRIKTGVRPFDPYQDLRAVAELIDVAFGDRLDPAGQATLGEMRRAARWGPLLGCFYHLWRSGIDLPPGFVWVDEGRVVGNVSLRRSSEWGGFLIGNVAVHPDWQRRGIAGALMKAALDEVAFQGGRWVGLEVEVDNGVARRLYEGEGFREVGRVLHMLRPAGLPWSDASFHHPALRRGRSSDGSSLVDLVRATVPQHVRLLLELRLQDYEPNWERALDHFLEGRRETWWVVEDGGSICAAARVLRERRRYPDRLEMLVSPECAGLFERALLRRAIATLQGAPQKAVEILLANATESVVTALRAAGFEELRTLVQMRLDLALGRFASTVN